MKSLKWRGGVALSFKFMKDMTGQGLAEIVDIKGRALYLVSVKEVREAQKKSTPGILNISLRIAWVTLWSQSYLFNDCRERDLKNK